MIDATTKEKDFETLFQVLNLRQSKSVFLDKLDNVVTRGS